MSRAILLDVTFTADELAAVDVAETAVVVVDVLRATTTITAALGSGAAGVWAVGSPEEARDLGGEWGAITAGERGGRQIAGLDLGNSPSEHATPGIAGRYIALTTSNGTRTIGLAADAPVILLGCFNNRAAVADVLADLDVPKILVACAGTDGGRRVTPEDVLFAGELVDRLTRGGACCAGGAVVARGYARGESGDLVETLRQVPAGRNLIELGYGADLEWAGRRDVTPVVPRVSSGPAPRTPPFIAWEGGTRPCR